MWGCCCFSLVSWAWLGRRERPCYGAMSVGADLPKDHAGGQDLSLGAGAESSLALHTGVSALPWWEGFWPLRLEFLVLPFCTVMNWEEATATFHPHKAEAVSNGRTASLGIGRLGPSSRSAHHQLDEWLWASVFTVCQMGMMMSFPWRWGGALKCLSQCPEGDVV